MKRTIPAAARTGTFRELPSDMMLLPDAFEPEKLIDENK